MRVDAENHADDFAGRLVSLKLDVDRLIEAMESESEQARQALSLYGRIRRLLSAFMRRAASHQGKACYLGQQLAACRERLQTLQRQYDGRAGAPGGQDAEEAKIARSELRRIAEQIRHWSVESDGLQ